MRPRRVLDRSTTPDGETLELALEGGHYIIRIGDVPLMSSAMSGSERAMADVAFEALDKLQGGRVLVGGLGMGFTLGAVLETFDDATEVCVAELLEDIVRYNKCYFGELAGYPLENRRAELFLGDVTKKLTFNTWDAILLDVDNGPNALSDPRNEGLYGQEGIQRIKQALSPNGVLVVWSAYSSRAFLAQLKRAGFDANSMKVRGRWPVNKGPTHTLFVAKRL